MEKKNPDPIKFIGSGLLSAIIAVLGYFMGVGVATGIIAVTVFESWAWALFITAWSNSIFVVLFGVVCSLFAFRVGEALEDWLK